LLNLELHVHGHLQLVSRALISNRYKMILRKLLKNQPLQSVVRVLYSTAAVVAVAGMGSEASKQGATKLKQAEA